MDNQAAIAISFNPELYSRTKDIDRRHFFVRECVENMQIRVPYVNTVDNLADYTSSRSHCLLRISTACVTSL